jgi:hypothetical protein
MKTQEQIFTQGEVLAAYWRALTPEEREGVWAEMRDDAAKVAAADGKVLTDTPGTRHVLYKRMVTEPEYLFRREAECSEGEAEFVRLRLTCWAEAK